MNHIGRPDFLLNRVFLYAIMGVCLVIGYALMVSGLSLLIGNFLFFNQPVIAGLVFFVMALLFNPIRLRIENLIDERFVNVERMYPQKLATFSGELTRATDLKAIIRILREYIEETFKPSGLYIFVYDPLTDYYLATLGKEEISTSDLKFPSNSDIIRLLSAHQETIPINSLDGANSNLNGDKARIQLLHAQLLIPLPGRKKLAGWIALGNKYSGKPYSTRDLQFLESLKDQTVLAMESAQVIINLENRVREMSVLGRVAQGINITLSLDDVLELIYAQTTQIIPADDFQLLMVDRDSGVPIRIFCIEDNERLSEKENQPTQGMQLLEQEVIRQRKAILTDDYTEEHQKLGFVEYNPSIHAWIGVPLNTGAETIGALSLGMRDLTVSYTREQVNLLQAIADQAAGAIVKANLLKETEQRARQLDTLNQVTRQLTSTLDISTLLHTILQSAAEILNCEAGSLLLVDEQTDELVFRETVGPVAGDLINKRLPPGSGVVGRAVRTRQAVIENNPRQSFTWFSETDKQTGFVTRAIMAVPLIIIEKVTGVIEVINRRDSMPFSSDDEALLSAFASQAAVAIENARLYTNTDQALAERVEELSVMQRIDRELNASLDINRAMHITLDWATRQSGAKAGFIGMVDEDGIDIVESDGYCDELEPYRDKALPLNIFNLQQVIDSGTPQISYGNQNGKGTILMGGLTQVVIPIRRENKTMGLLLLENNSSDKFGEEITSFLVRLTDHAAIAISNAQLYAAVQAANVAKSEFVSFVSHELKNPMTSIKGYSELLSAGAVGPVNEAQANFLVTIRSNVERMSTLVSDLADVSRIEAGKLKLEFKLWELKDIGEEVSRSLKRQIEEKKQQLSIQISEDIPTIWADRTRMIQVMTNLISNAYKYTPAGGQIIVSASACVNEWDPAGPLRVVHVWVRDNGIGINEEDQRKIFQKFFRSEDPKTREATGTGLGLNITKSLIEMQGGKIWFESEFRKGTTFHFTIPVAE